MSISADVLVTAKSSFSYIAAVFASLQTPRPIVLYMAQYNPRIMSWWRDADEVVKKGRLSAKESKEDQKEAAQGKAPLAAPENEHRKVGFSSGVANYTDYGRRSHTGIFRNRWTEEHLASDVVKKIKESQSNCSAHRLSYHQFRQRSGFGSELHFFSWALKETGKWAILNSRFC